MHIKDFFPIRESTWLLPLPALQTHTSVVQVVSLAWQVGILELKVHSWLKLLIFFYPINLTKILQHYEC